ncbi:putative Glycoprotein-N-acetylgalactosamine 3-beta-galactosyltransferase 1 [Hypsibius exemplaris]|uniref:Glycoprotein-N-acetylgalactosamine 3-beta-galactosyltransferase 1 n=1 Tax=Hypsibius exemplaris TaxID=2072580 RepID=A0A1W0WUL6_HYPEX|nr:putative Glycoprotein-N-acetylgalactosamine 3-beta-galactosyltransferase 1 [Hypsibius exemplaris]
MSPRHRRRDIVLMIASATSFCFLTFRHYSRVGHEGSLQEGSPRLPQIFCTINYKYEDEEAATAIMETWAQKCDGYVFISTRKRLGMSTIVVPSNHSEYLLWAKIHATLRHAVSNDLKPFDWVLATDSTTFVILENLRLFLANQSETDSMYFADDLTPAGFGGFRSPGSVYVLSRQTLSRMTKVLRGEKCITSSSNRTRKQLLDECARRAGIYRDNRSIESFGRGPAFPYDPSTYWQSSDDKSDVAKASSLLSGNHSQAVTFRHITPIYMYILEYLIYVLKPHRTETEL